MAGRRTLGRAAALLLPITLIACGGQAARILSTVGSSVGDGAAAAAPSMAPTAAPSEAPGNGEGGGDGQGSGGGAPAALQDETKIVYTGSLDLVVGELQPALAKARAAIAGVGGYVGGSRETNGDHPVASITFRIPAAQWEAGLTALRAIATKVVDEQTSAVEVTGQLVDLEARIRNLRASETSLQGIAANATKVSDLLEIQRELTSVRGEIERLDGQRAALADKTAYGTLVATFGLEVVAVREAAKGWDPASEVDRASASLVSVLQTLATAGIWFGIVWLPILLALTLIGIAGTFALRRLGVLRPRSPVGGWPPAT
jgi:hypothetical protein